MRLGYMGSPEISARLLSALLDSPHQICFVVSNPDAPRGRSSRPVPTEVARLALDRELPLYRPLTLKDGALAAEIAGFAVDLIVVFAYGRLLPPAIFDLPPAGTINLHASLLPLLRGASPIQSALLEGFTETGWSVQFIAQGMDTGDVLASSRLPIGPGENAAELGERMVPDGIELVLTTLAKIERTLRAGGNVRALATPQAEERATHCKKITTEMAQIDWRQSAPRIHNLIRALNPRPVARTFFSDDGAMLKVYRSSVIAPELCGQVAAPSGPAPVAWLQREPGAFGPARLDYDGGRLALVVRAGEGLLELLELQPEGRKKLTAKEFLNGYRKADSVTLGSIAK